MMRILEEAEKSRWKYSLNKLIHAYNCTENETTRYSPYYLMFGKEPRLPIDLILDNPESPVPKRHTDYLKQWEKSMSEAYKIAAKNAEQWKSKDSERRNSRATLGTLKPGDRVLMRNLSQRGGPGKLRSYWEPDVHVVVEVKDDTGLVYAISSEKDKSGKVRVVHRNHLLPCSTLPLEFLTELQKSRKTRKTSKKKLVAQEVGNVNDTDSDEDVEVWVTNKPTENVYEDFNSNDASVCDNDVESLSSESELKLLEHADMKVSVETDAGEVHANVGSNEVLQPEQDEEIQDSEDLAPGDMEEVTESTEEMSVLEEQPDVCPQRIRRPCDRLTYYDWGSSLPSINQINSNRIPQTMGVPLIKYCMFL